MNDDTAFLLFVAVAVFGAARLFYCSRVFDAFSLAYAAALLYFLPAYFGYARYPTSFSLGEPVALAPETYVVYAAVLASIALSGHIFDRLPEVRPALSLSGGDLFPLALSSVAALSLAFAFLISGSSLLDPDKDAVLAGMNRWYGIAMTATALLGAFMFASPAKRRPRWLFLLGTFILLDIYIGFRDTFAFTLCSFLLLYVGSQGRRPFLTSAWKLILATVSAVLILFIYKGVAAVLKLGAWDILVDNLTNPNIYAEAVTRSEPFTIQAILNETLISGFRVEFAHFSSAVVNAIPFSPELGIRTQSFNALFQPVLFPEAEFGMANNIWAEMMASGGWCLLIAFLVVFNILLATASFWLRSRDPHIRAASALLCSQWAFYIHRNDLTFELTLLKRTVFVFALCFLLEVLLLTLATSKSSSGISLNT